MNDLIINGKDAFATWGLRMGESFLDSIDDFPTMKPYIVNESRLVDGRIVHRLNSRIESRQINLSFTIEGLTEEDYRLKRKSFISELCNGMVNVKVPALGNDVYKLIYLGKGASYALSRDRTFSKIVLKFEEPNPADRK